MSKKLNCWEYKNCGREKGGLMAPVLGECPVPTAMGFDGLNDGQGAGRACWMIAHSPTPTESCGRGTCTRRCHTCEFYKRVVFEQEEHTCYRFTSVGV